MKITEIFKLPLKVDNNYIFDDNNQMIYQFTQSCPYLLKKTIENRLTIPGCNEITSFQLEYRDGTIYIDECTHDTAVIDIRAWGYLTSPNCCGFSVEQALMIQDEIGKQFISELTTGDGNLLYLEFPFELSDKAKSFIAVKGNNICIIDDSFGNIVNPYRVAPYMYPDIITHLTKAQREAKYFDIRREPKIQRNQPCPCNSGKKFKNCCINK